MPNRWQATSRTNSVLIDWRIYAALGGDELTPCALAFVKRPDFFPYTPVTGIHMAIFTPWKTPAIFVCCNFNSISCYWRGSSKVTFLIFSLAKLHVVTNSSISDFYIHFVLNMQCRPIFYQKQHWSVLVQSGDVDSVKLLIMYTSNISNHQQKMYGAISWKKKNAPETCTRGQTWTC